MLRRKPKSSHSKLVAKLDEVFSQYIRLKHSNAMGYCRCISCGQIHKWNDIQNGHYMSRRYMSTRWSEDNCRPQCVACNIFNQGNIQMYRRALVKEIGEQRVNIVEVRAMREVAKYSDWELRDMIEEYKNKVLYYKKIKGL